MANSSGAITLLVLSFVALVVTVLVLWWLEWSRPPPNKSRQPNVFITQLQPKRTKKRTITLINPMHHTGKLTINDQEFVLRVGRNIINVPSDVNSMNFGWQLANGPIRVAPSTPTIGGEVYILLNDGLFRKGEWSSNTPIQIVPLPYSANNVVKAFQSGYTITPATSGKSSVSISEESIKNAYTGLPLHIKFTTGTSSNVNKSTNLERESSGNRNKGITATITNPGIPLVVFQSMRWLGDSGGIIELHATQDPITIVSTSNASLYLQISKQPGSAGKIYEIYPGTNYIDGENPENRWFQLISYSGQPRGGWMPVDNYRTNGEKLF